MFDINLKFIHEKKDVMFILNNILSKENIEKAPLNYIKIILFENYDINDLKKIKEIIKNNPGRTKVYLKIENSKGILKLNNNFESNEINLLKGIKSIKEIKIN